MLCAALLTGAASISAQPQALAAEASRPFAGVPVGDVLDNLRPQGLTFIYNTHLVPPDLRVEAEPSARRGLALAEEILAAHGLHVSQVTPGVFAVVPGADAADPKGPEASAASAGDTMLEEVIVQTSRYTLHSDFAVSEALLTHEDIQNLPSLGEEPLRAVQRLPGVAGNGFSSLGAVRGGEPSETAIVLDGLRLYEPFHLKNFLSPVSLLDSRVIQSMQVYSGGFPVIHGDRMSSIIDAATVEPTQPRYYEAGLSLFHTSLLAASQFAEDRGRGLISLRRSNLGDLASLSEHDFGKPEYFDGFAKADYRLNVATQLSLNLLASSDRILAIRNSGAERANAEYRNTYFWGALEHDWADGAQSRVILSYTDVNNERDGRVDEPQRRFGRVRDYRNFHVVGLRADHEFEAWGLEHRLGLEVRRPWGGYDYQSDVRFEAGYPFPDSAASEIHRLAAPKPDGVESGAWWDSRMELSGGWTVQAGLRVDTQTYDASGDDEQIAPRLNVMYALSDATRLRASWGRFWQSHAINELPVEDGVENFYPAQHADHLILSLDRTLRVGLDLRIEAYRKDYKEINPRFENLFNPLVLLPETEFDRVMIAPSGARAEGVEVLLRWQSQGPWRAWFGYTWSQARDSIDGRMVPRSWDQKHAINAGAGWASGPWSVTVTNSFHTGWPITRLRLDEDGVQPVIGERNAERLGDYNSLDVRLTRTFALTRGALDVFFEATNLLSRDNPCCIEYTVTRAADGTTVLEEEVEYWLPLVPSIGVLWRY
jgi:TonB dependent receptor/TonB-dependent Receptor Plug Domain